MAVAANPVTNKIYVVNCNQCGQTFPPNVSNVSVIDGTNDSVVATVNTGADSLTPPPPTSLPHVVNCHP